MIEIYISLNISVFFIVAVFYQIYYIINSPLRRKESTMLFLNFISTSLDNGNNPEIDLQEIALQNKNFFGYKLNGFLTSLNKNKHLGNTLEMHHHFLHPKIAQILVIGLKTDTFKQCVQACTSILDDQCFKLRAKMHYLIIIFLGFPLILYSILQSILIFVYPSFMKMIDEFGFEHTFIIEAFDHNFNNIAFYIFMAITLYTLYHTLGTTILLIFSSTGFLPYFIIKGRESSKSIFSFLKTPDSLFYYFTPWLRNRLVRDYTTLLAIFLDSGFSEKKSIQHTSLCINNYIFTKRSNKMITMLSEGYRLDESIKILDHKNFYRLNLAFSKPSKINFSQSINSWTQFLNIKANFQENIFAQSFATFAILINGLFVALVAYDIFNILIMITNHTILW